MHDFSSDINLTLKNHAVITWDIFRNDGSLLGDSSVTGGFPSQRSSNAKVWCFFVHYSDVIMTTIASQITRLTIVYSTLYICAGERKHESSAPLAFVRGIHRWPVNSPHKGPVTQKMFTFDDVIMVKLCNQWLQSMANMSFSVLNMALVWFTGIYHFIMKYKRV